MLRQTDRIWKIETQKILENLKKEINLLASDMEKQDAAEFYSELADWAYANGEAMLMEDEPEMQDYENQ